MISRNSFVALLVALGFSLGFGTNAALSQDLIRNFTPAAWQADQINWVRDQNPQNGIEDSLDLPFDDFRDIVINFRRCLTDSDIDYLETLSDTSNVQMVLKYITSVAMSDVRFSEIQQLMADLPHIAFIEEQHLFQTNLDVSVATIAITPSVFHSPNTVMEQCPVDGSGVIIAIIDTGVDNTNDPAFAGTTLVASYSSLNGSFADPPDPHGHGTHVASIALGQATASHGRGVAPGAGLIDVRTLDAAGNGTFPQVTDAIQTTYDNRVAWGLDIINLSLGGGPSDDGLAAIPQLLDLAESMGIVVVCAAGNNGGNSIAVPASATRAITVASFNDMNTVDPADDLISDFTNSIFSSNWGPRPNDGDFDFYDELKPEVAAPGSNITAAGGTLSGTSMAAPHVAGVAALIMEANPGINAASVRDLIISTADLPAAVIPNPPGHAPATTQWHTHWGFGVIDPLEAVCPPPVICDTDVTFPSLPWTPSWLSPDISTSVPPVVNNLVTVFADIENAGPNLAEDVSVHFGVHVYSASTPTFFDIGTVVVDIPANTIVTVPMNWIPAAASHQCMYVEIGYGCDTNFSNNTAARNLTVGTSPVKFEVQNTLTETPQEIFFFVELDDPDQGWEFTIEPAVVFLGADDCPEIITVELIPPAGLPPGTENMMHIAAVMAGAAGNVVELGGVTVLQRVPGENCTNGVDDDNDDLIDCEDPDCFNHSACTDPPITIGDPNADGEVNIADVIVILQYLFNQSAINCVAASNLNGDSQVDIGDPVYLLYYLFNQGAPPVGGAECTPDTNPANADLGCEDSGCG